MPTCHQCSVLFEITDADRAFYNKVSPVFGGVKYLIPEPTMCPDCRQQRRLSWRNERKLYNRTCNHCQKAIVSVYQPNVLFPVFCQQCWWSDTWDAHKYGQNFDFSKPFFEQFQQLFHLVPKMAVQQFQNENSEYTNCTSHLQNCYLMFSSDFNRDCYYGVWVQNSQDSMDNFLANHCQLTYEAVFSNNIFNSVFILFSSHCSDSSFLSDCRNCSNCFMCYGLRNKQYHIENKAYSKEEYLQKIQNLKLTSYPKLKVDFLEKVKNASCLFMRRNGSIEDSNGDFLEKVKNASCLFMRRNGSIEDSNGDFLTNVKNCKDCYEIVEGRDCQYVQGAYKITDTQDCSYVHGELGYENCECFPMPVRSAFNINSYTGNDMLYSDMCMNNNANLFGCIGLRHKKYCILNKQYTKEEYEILVPKIIDHMRNTGEWGEFFPASISPFGYNETVANEYFPLSRDAALQRLFKWSDYEAPKPQAAKTITAENMSRLPDSIDQIPDDIINWALTCEVSGKLYKIQKAELAFYRKMKLPIPHRHPDQRHADRMALRNPRRLWKRNCAECNTAIETTYSPDRPEKVLCEGCYLKAVV